MSIFAVERALYDVANNPALGMQYGQNPDDFLSGYALTDQERREIKEMDVKSMAANGASHMLLMMFWVAANRGLHTMPEYVKRLNS